ncbi:Non-structural maintenance of chromosomes element 1 [Blastocladiella emersonii ATCC 22665]|nr:Non-structural maintenance of chromosomes element 1 [Blastocladiella emersonii ATCC 22665]
MDLDGIGLGPQGNRRGEEEVEEDRMDVDLADPLNVQRLYLQAHLRTPCMQYETALGVYERCCHAAGLPFDANHYETFLTQVNQRIDSLDLSVKHVEHHTRDAAYCMLVNARADDIAKLATTLKPAELSVFRVIVSKIAEGTVGQLSSMEILNCVPSVAGTTITKAAFQASVLPKLVHDAWLEETNAGFFTLGVRALTELRQYLLDAHPELPQCVVCSEVALIHVACPSGDAVFHRRCLDTRRNRAGALLPCPTCKTAVTLPGTLFPRATQGAVTGRRKRPRVQADDEEEAEGGEEDEIEED